MTHPIVYETPLNIDPIDGWMLYLKRQQIAEAAIKELAPSHPGWVHQAWERATSLPLTPPATHVDAMEVCARVAIDLGGDLAAVDEAALAEIFARACMAERDSPALGLAMALTPFADAFAWSADELPLAAARPIWTSIIERSIELAVAQDPEAMTRVTPETEAALAPRPGGSGPRALLTAGLHERIVSLAAVACEARAIEAATEPRRARLGPKKSL